MLQLSKRNDNIKILPNCTGNKVLTFLSRAKVLFHPMPNEHFRIAVVETIAAADCLPIVHKSGETIEIVENGRYSVGYNQISEHLQLLNYAFNSS